MMDFLNDTTYGVGLTLETQDGAVLSTSISYFNVSYASPEITNTPSAIMNCDNDSLLVQWSPALINQGIVSGVGTEPFYQYVTNQPYVGGVSVKINNNADITWWVGSETSPIPFSYESTTYLNWTVPNGQFSGVIYEQTGEYVNLLTITTVEPSECSVGDKYYNPLTKLIYTAIATNQWADIGETPVETSMYYTLDTNLKYLWNNDTTLLTQTTYDLPTYVVSYANGSFHYEISNLDFQASGDIPVFSVDTKWLLQPVTADPNQNYVWLDTATWNDNLVWFESSSTLLAKSWYKIVLLPTEIQVVANAVQ